MSKTKFKEGDIVYMMSEIREPIACEVINVYPDEDDREFNYYEVRDIDSGEYIDGTESGEFSEAFSDVNKFVKHWVKKLKQFAKEVKEGKR